METLNPSMIKVASLYKEWQMRFKSSIFMQSVAVAAISYLLFRFLYWFLYWLASALGSLSHWLRWRLVPWSEEAAIALGIIYLIVSLIVSSRDS